MATLNWKPVISSLLETLIQAGYTLGQVDNGEDQKDDPTFSEAVEAITDCDQTTLIIYKDARQYWLAIVLGNDPCETVSNYSGNSEELDKLMEQWSDMWEHTPCPVDGQGVLYIPRANVERYHAAIEALRAMYAKDWPFAKVEAGGAGLPYISEHLFSTEWERRANEAHEKTRKVLSDLGWITQAK